MTTQPMTSLNILRPTAIINHNPKFPRQFLSNPKSASTNSSESNPRIFPLQCRPELEYPNGSSAQHPTPRPPRRRITTHFLTAPRTSTIAPPPYRACRQRLTLPISQRPGPRHFLPLDASRPHSRRAAPGFMLASWVPETIKISRGYRSWLMLALRIDFGGFASCWR